jgi:hypothetical protein
MAAARLGSRASCSGRVAPRAPAAFAAAARVPVRRGVLVAAATAVARLDDEEVESAFNGLDGGLQRSSNGLVSGVEIACHARPAWTPVVARWRLPWPTPAPLPTTQGKSCLGLPRSAPWPARSSTSTRSAARCGVHPHLQGGAPPPKGPTPPYAPPCIPPLPPLTPYNTTKNTSPPPRAADEHGRQRAHGGRAGGGGVCVHRGPERRRGGLR